jgi:hypothetical protein
MAGYDGLSMSNNARKAYEEGEKPKSKWTKKVILETVEKSVKSGELELVCSFDKLKKVPLPALQEYCLVLSSWHHTSMHYNRTYFYKIELGCLEAFTDEDIDELLEEYKAKISNKKREDTQEEMWECKYLSWRRGWKTQKSWAKEVTAVGIIKGNWFYLPNGHRKSINANGFEKIRKIEE